MTSSDTTRPCTPDPGQPTTPDDDRCLCQLRSRIVARHLEELADDDRGRGADQRRVEEICRQVGLTQPWARLSPPVQDMVRHVAALEVRLDALGDRITERIQSARTALLGGWTGVLDPVTPDAIELEMTQNLIGGVRLALADVVAVLPRD